MSETKIFNVNWIPAAGSALGAVTSAVVLSTLGVAGTLIGAALGSLVITIGGSIYAQSIERTKAHIGNRVIKAKGRTGGDGDTPSGSSAPEAHPAVSEEDRGAAREVARKTPGKWRSLPWKRILGLTAALFVVTMAVILAFELTTGRTVSSYTGGSSSTSGGTSIPGVSGFRNTTDGTGTTPEDQQQDQLQQNQVPGEEPTVPDDQAPAPDDGAPAAPDDAPEQRQQVPEQQQAPEQQGGQDQGGQNQAPAPGGQEQAPAQ